MKNFLKKASKAYYNGEPIVSDQQFDYLAEKYCYDIIGSKDGDSPHFQQMYSLKKLYNDDDYINELNGETIITPKLDGSSLALVYENGYLTSATTRGDGIRGKDCTHNILAHPDIPNVIPNIAKLQITGEIVVPKIVRNARNVAAGALNLKDSEEFLKRDVTFVVYGLSDNVQSLYYMFDMKLLQTWGFNSITNSTYDEFPQDGKVYRLDSNVVFQNLGYTNSHPRGSFALKDRDDEEVVETTLREVLWGLGKGGKVSPRARFDKIEIDGAVIEYATLHNPGFIENMKLDIGDTILVVRSGGVIPKIIGKL